MTINSDSYQSIPAPVVRSNLELLGTFKRGEKPVTRGSTLSKEDRYAQTIRRAWEGAFDPQVLASTYRSAKDICEKAKNPYLYERSEELMSDAKAIEKLAVKSLEGLKQIENNYRKEAEIVYFNADNKLITAEKLKFIYDTYHPVFTPRNRSVSALISVFDRSSSAKKNSSKKRQSSKKQESHVSSVRNFWKENEQKALVQPPLKAKRTSNQQTSDEPNISVSEDTQTESRHSLSIIQKEPEQGLPPAKKIGVKRKRVTTILRRMAQETLDKVRSKSKKKKKKSYKEKSFIKSYVQEKGGNAGSVGDELKAIFDAKSSEISKRYEHFESHQEEEKKKKLQSERQAQVSCFDLNMLTRFVEDYDGVPDDDFSDGSNHSSWNDRDEEVMSMRREVIVKAQTRPLTRSISVYPGTINQHKPIQQKFEIKTSSVDEYFRERLKQIRTCTEYSYSGDDKTEDDYFSDDDPFEENIS